MNDLRARLTALEKPITFVLIGGGSAGKGIFYQSLITPGFRCLGLADIHLSKAVEAAEAFGREYRIVHTEKELEDAVREGRVAVCEDAGLLVGCESAAAVVDASSALAAAARFDAEALRRGKHLIMMNAEADLAFGPYFWSLARQNGVCYSSCDGDQPAAIMRLVEELRLWNFDLVMAGNIKGFLNRYADPATIVPEADKRGLDPKMCASYTDGTKICVEMALVANGLGLRTPIPGMLGPRVSDLYEVFDVFDFDTFWRNGGGVVDYVIGPRPKGGIFAIGHHDHPFQKFMLDWFPSEMGPGPYYLFYRPYHLIHIESLRTVADAVLDRRSLLAPWHGFRTDVYAYAKRPLRRGEILDGIGGFSCYGLIENFDGAIGRPGLPITLAEHVALRRDIDKDGKIFWEDVDIDPVRPDFEAYALARAASDRLSPAAPRD